jgi:hypothetical protein
MRTLYLALIIVLALTGCSVSADRQWMKVNERYTTEEFRRDYKACSPKDELDEDCMRSRGWVEVSRSKAERDSDPRPAEPAHTRPAGLPSMGGIRAPSR